ncbi:MULTISPECIES: hypothetical protein [unclassified Agarivorans]|uniref:hypothetical protein n=1 Tax=unclassified Agarivorans TaxID=2636026 RepID=UPI003D7E9C2D
MTDNIQCLYLILMVFLVILGWHGLLLIPIAQSSQISGAILVSEVNIANKGIVFSVEHSGGRGSNPSKQNDVMQSGRKQSAADCCRGKQSVQGGIQAIQDLRSAVSHVASDLTRLKNKAFQVQNFVALTNALAQQAEQLADDAQQTVFKAGEQSGERAAMADQLKLFAKHTAQISEDIAGALTNFGDDTANSRQLMAHMIDKMDTVEDCITHFERVLSRTEKAVEAFAQMQIEQSLRQQSGTGELIFMSLDTDQRDMFDQRILNHARAAAMACGGLLEQALVEEKFTESQLFEPDYQPIENTEPTKYSTAFDSYTDQHFPDVQDPILQALPNIVYAGAVDKRGYFPTHNRCYSQALTGDYERDIKNNRTKRVFDDPIGIRSATHCKSMLLQTYKRDTGEVMHDLSVPIWVEGKHWGAFRIGFKPS